MASKVAAARLQRAELKAAAKKAIDAVRSGEHLFDAFLTHDWGTDELGRSTHERVVSVAKKLEDMGFRVWLDENEMRGDVNKQMVEGIESSGCTVVFITSRYLQKASGYGPNGDDDNWCGSRTWPPWHLSSSAWSLSAPSHAALTRFPPLLCSCVLSTHLPAQQVRVRPRVQAA